MKQLFVISSYPTRAQTHDPLTVGVASYTKNTLKAIRTQMPDTHITVWAEIHEPGIEEVYEEDGMTIKRVWRRGDMHSLWHLYAQTKSRNVQDMLIPIEPDMFGNYLHLAWFVGLMSLLNASGKHITSVLHQVKLDDIKYPVSKVKTRLSAFVLNLFYSSVLAASTDTIVFERVFKARLEEQCIQKRLFDLAAHTHLLRKRTGKPSTINQKLPTIHVVPHAVEELKRVPDQQTAKKRLRWNPRHKYVLCFGFITAQKGLDRLIEMWEPNKKVHLILAGGENPLYAKHKSYKKFVKKVRDAAQKKNIQVTGFVPEKKIATYFAASDLVILPYSRLTASSGPLSLAFAAEKPVLFSEGVADYFETSDFRRALAEIKLTKKEFVFRFTPEDFQQHLKEMLTHLPQATQFSKSMKELRNWSNISNLYVKLLNR